MTQSNLHVVQHLHGLIHYTPQHKTGTYEGPLLRVEEHTQEGNIHEFRIIANRKLTAEEVKGVRGYAKHMYLISDANGQYVYRWTTNDIGNVKNGLLEVEILTYDTTLQPEVINRFFVADDGLIVEALAANEKTILLLNTKHPLYDAQSTLLAEQFDTTIVEHENLSPFYPDKGSDLAQLEIDQPWEKVKQQLCADATLYAEAKKLQPLRMVK